MDSSARRTESRVDKSVIKVAVCSRSFSANESLRAELLREYPQVLFNDAGAKLEGDSLVAFLRGQHKAIVALETVDRGVLEQLPDLEVISKYGVGLDKIDLGAIRDLGKRLGWTSGVNRRSVAELVICFAIAALRHVPAAHREVLAGVWRQHVGGYLSGRTVGIVGCGHVGKDVVKLLAPFECPVLAHDIRDYSDFYKTHSVETVELDQLLRRSDVVTLHLPLDSSTVGMLDVRALSLMKRTAVLINAARGGIVDESALKHMLMEKRLAAAAFDVFSTEPPVDTELLALPNFLATPHIGGSAEEAILAMGRAAIIGLDQNSIPE
jgi:phosphoglycerate dehydrogenase-like enzyme